MSLPLTNPIIEIIIIIDNNKGLNMKDINEIMLNPIRLRIVQELAGSKEMTTNELCEKLPDIARATLYRHVNLLLENNILAVISEKKVRGSLERTLSLNVGEISKQNTLENAAQTALTFLMSKYASFQKYFSADDPQPGKDKVFLNNTILMANDEEFDQFLLELRNILIKYNFEFAEGRRARDISIISAPLEKEKKAKNEKQ